MADTTIPTLYVPRWLPDRLKDAGVRYGWAASHVPRLNDVLREFNDAISWKAEQSPELPEGMVRLRIFQNPPREIGLIIGDIVHSLRASLDYATCALLQIQNKDADLSRVQFPFGRPGHALNSKERGPFSSISMIALPYIEEARARGYYLLDILNKASNQDKHRLIAAMLHRQLAMKVVNDTENDTADIVPDVDRADLWMMPLQDGDIIEMGNMLSLRPGFVVEGDAAPYPLTVVLQLFYVTHQTLGLMIEAAMAMLTMQGAGDGQVGLSQDTASNIEEGSGKP